MFVFKLSGILISLLKTLLIRNSESTHEFNSTCNIITAPILYEYNFFLINNYNIKNQKDNTLIMQPYKCYRVKH